jgi:hypothetical protein
MEINKGLAFGLCDSSKKFNTLVDCLNEKKK